MIRAIIPTYEPGGLNAKIYPHWKDSPTFTIVNIEDSKYTCSDIVKLSEDLIIDVIKRNHINVVLTLSLSIRALELLDKIGVKVYIGKCKYVDEIVKEFIRNKLLRVNISKCLGGIKDFKL
ncbi:MAG TPA: hypothetical protein ENF47_06155 [Thermoprotei archaeon]|nr:hypothetical protein [Thermoprotei archaeon]